MKNVELIEKAIELLEGGKMRGNEGVVSELLVKHVMCNTTIKTLNKLSVRDLKRKKGKDDNRVFVNTVYMDSDNKVAVSTTGSYLFINPDEYTDEFGESVILDAENNVVDGKYPSYRMAMEEKEWHDCDFGDADELMEKAKRSIAVSQLNEDFCGVVYIKMDFDDGINIPTEAVPYIVLFGTDGWKHSNGKFHKKMADGKEFLFMGVKLTN